MRLLPSYIRTFVTCLWVKKKLFLCLTFGTEVGFWRMAGQKSIFSSQVCLEFSSMCQNHNYSW